MQSPNEAGQPRQSLSKLMEGTADVSLLNVRHKDCNIILLAATVNHIKCFCCSSAVRSQGILINGVIEGYSTQSLSNDACSLCCCDLGLNFGQDGFISYIVKEAV